MNAVYAIVDGKRVQVARRYGSTPAEVYVSLKNEREASLTGSAFQYVETANGSFVRADRITEFK